MSRHRRHLHRYVSRAVRSSCSLTFIDREQQSAVPAPTDTQASTAWHAPAPVVSSIGASSTSVLETAQSPAPLQPQPQPQPLGSSPLPIAAQTQTQQPQFPPGVKLDAQRPPSAVQQAPQQQQAPRNMFPGSLSDLVASFENVKQKGELDGQPLGCAEDAWHTDCIYSCLPPNSGAPHDELGPGAQIA
jgi:hypothetical protein